MINDDQGACGGQAGSLIENLEGKMLASSETRFHMEGADKTTCEVSLSIPRKSGKYLLKAVAYPQGTRHKSPTVSCRKVVVNPAPLK